MAQLSVHAAASLAQLSVPGRLAVSAYGLSFYLWKTVAPVNLSLLYELGPVDPWATPFMLSYGGVLAITALAWARRRSWPGLPAAWLAYVVILLPVLGIFQSGPQIAADRYTYLAGLGWAILVSAGLLSCWQAWRFPLTGLAVCVLLGLGVLSWNQVRVWHDSETLWTHALATYPQSSIAENNLGLLLAKQGKPAEAIEHYRRALQITPAYASAHHNWGLALAQQGQLAEAIEHFRQALKIRPDFADAFTNLGNALALQGKPAEAIEHYRHALTIKPDFADAFTNLGNALAQQGKPAEAIEHYRRALTIKPDYAEVHNNLGVTLAQQGQVAEAIEHYRRALAIKPDYAEAHNNLGVMLAQQGQVAEAIEHYRQALTIKPDYAQARKNWSLALVQQGKPAEAIGHFQRPLRTRPAGPSNTTSSP